MDTKKTWRFCAVGNIKAQHVDADGTVRYGTRSFTGGTKVYIDDRTWGAGDGTAGVIGLNRFGRYVTDHIPVGLIENIRFQRVFKPTVLKIMDYLEVMEGWPWRGRTAEDRKELCTFAEAWKIS